MNKKNKFMRLCCLTFKMGGKEHGPFKKIISFDYYDGTTEGITICSICNNSFKYKMVDNDLGDPEVRIFLLSRLASGAFESVVHLLTAVGAKPKWPIWVPIWTELMRDVSLDNYIRANSTQIVLASICFPHQIIAFRRLVVKTSKLHLFSTKFDWFCFLGLKRRKCRGVTSV